MTREIPFLLMKTSLLSVVSSFIKFSSLTIHYLILNFLKIVPCNPGEYRLGTQCVYCDSGKASTTGDTCEFCPAGTAAVKALFLDNFDFWDSGLSTDCAYFCGSPFVF